MTDRHPGESVELIQRTTLRAEGSITYEGPDFLVVGKHNDIFISAPTRDTKRWRGAATDTPRDQAAPLVVAGAAHLSPAHAAPCLRLLIDAKADVSAASPAGATPAAHGTRRLAMYAAKLY